MHCSQPYVFLLWNKVAGYHESTIKRLMTLFTSIALSLSMSCLGIPFTCMHSYAMQLQLTCGSRTMRTWIQVVSWGMLWFSIKTDTESAAQLQKHNYKQSQMFNDIWSVASMITGDGASPGASSMLRDIRESGHGLHGGSQNEASPSKQFSSRAGCSISQATGTNFSAYGITESHYTIRWWDHDWKRLFSQVSGGIAAMLSSHRVASFRGPGRCYTTLGGPKAEKNTSILSHFLTNSSRNIIRKDFSPTMETTMATIITTTYSQIEGDLGHNATATWRKGQVLDPNQVDRGPLPLLPLTWVHRSITTSKTEMGQRYAQEDKDMPSMGHYGIINIGKAGQDHQTMDKSVSLCKV